MDYELRVKLPLQMESEQEYYEAIEEGENLEFFSRYGSFISLIFLLFSNVSSGLLFCSIELF